MVDCTAADDHDSKSRDASHGTRIPTQQNPQSEALREFLDEWAEEAGSPDPEDVAAMRRRYFPK
ncbi:MAG: hypothetical protein F4Z06_00495 [Acidimicrobiia bacterium]|nr:hypothetical protein [Acidimicrobiia bacterium]MYE74235.1 hypothetical protein [Acidimicrobiia bacterium]MYJ61742.1 hypothetical protein [Acidimicrobiia bacterium]